MEPGKYYKTEKGTPQGGIISPILANIYLHYVLDLWFKIVIKRTSRGIVEMVRYADDFVICVQYQDESSRIVVELRKRLEKFGLELFLFNITNRNAYLWFFAALGIFPFITIFNYKQLPDLLKRYFWVILPVWFIVHFFLGSVEESRLFLVPQIIVFLPSSFYAIQKSITGTSDNESDFSIKS